MREYYPEIDPYAVDFLKVSNIHTIYYEQSGNPEGMPVLVVHGGPGLGIQPNHRRIFDPEKYRIIAVDQRGCGKSTPQAELKENTTQNLISDFELLRQTLGIERWLLCGGSWGSTLSIAYAETHPEIISGLLLRGIFLGRQQDVDWLFQGKGARCVFPDFWQKFINILSANEQKDLIASYYARLTSHDENTQQTAVKAWAELEMSVVSLKYNAQLIAETLNTPTALTLALFECHYFMNHCFLQENQLLNEIDRIAHIPLWIVHGRYDMICVLQNAWDLHQAHPQSKLFIVPEAGHAGSEPGVVDRMIQLTDEIAKRGEMS